MVASIPEGGSHDHSLRAEAPGRLNHADPKKISRSVQSAGAVTLASSGQVFSDPEITE
jgi:hypothetical protein